VQDAESWRREIKFMIHIWVGLIVGMWFVGAVVGIPLWIALRAIFALVFS
jgi:hypothetical protein